MNARRLTRSLRRIVGPHACRDDPASLAAYAYDSSLQTATPELVVFPRTTNEVAQIVRLFHREKAPYVARGAGTNLSGGSVPLGGGAVIVLAGMKRIVEIDPRNLRARVEPGITNMAFQEALAAHGFFFAPDPASQRVSTIGGNVAENSGGPHCLKYGVTTNHILGLRVVAPDGEIVDLGADSFDGPAYDLMGLFVGSEGTLGIATEITCRILPLPEAVSTMLAIFGSTDEASQAVSDIIAAGIVPATLEMMDNLIIRAVEASLQAGYPLDAGAVLIIDIDGLSEGLEGMASEIEAICRRNGVREMRTATDTRERERLWAGRRGAFGAVMRLFKNYSVSDGTVPRARLPEALRRIAEIGRAHDLQIGNVFHAGDGNLHPLIFFDSADAEQMERVHHAAAAILAVCTEAGGTITGEHGVGAEKIYAMPLVFGPGEIDLMRGVKRALDPAGLCNPKKILPESATAPEPAAADGTMPVSSNTIDGAPAIRARGPGGPGYDHAPPLAQQDRVRPRRRGDALLRTTIPARPAGAHSHDAHVGDRQPRRGEHERHGAGRPFHRRPQRRACRTWPVSAARCPTAGDARRNRGLGAPRTATTLPRRGSRPRARPAVRRRTRATAPRGREHRQERGRIRLWKIARRLVGHARRDH
jgi:glycolate oxidase subunit GlcD